MPRAKAEITDQGLRITECRSEPDASGEVFPWNRVIPGHGGLGLQFRVMPDPRTSPDPHRPLYQGPISKAEFFNIRESRRTVIENSGHEGELDLALDTSEDWQYMPLSGLIVLFCWLFSFFFAYRMYVLPHSGWPPFGPGTGNTAGQYFTNLLVAIGWATMMPALLAGTFLLGWWVQGSRRVLRVNARAITIERLFKPALTIPAEEIESVTVGSMNTVKITTSGGTVHKARVTTSIPDEALLALGYMDESQIPRAVRRRRAVRSL